MAQPTPLLTASTQSTSTNGNSVEMSGVGMATVTLTITASAGSSPTLHAWLQGSNDGGLTWVDVPHIQRLKSSATGADVTASIVKRNIADNESGACEMCANYYVVPALVRLKWIIGGTGGPTFTFGADIKG